MTGRTCKTSGEIFTVSPSRQPAPDLIHKKTTNLLLWFCGAQCNRGTVITLNGAQLFHCWLDWPSSLGTSFTAITKRIPSAAKQSGQCMLIHWLPPWCKRLLWESDVRLYASFSPAPSAAISPFLRFLSRGPLHFFPSPSISVSEAVQLSLHQR